jgi:hypothetical protein
MELKYKYSLLIFLFVQAIQAQSTFVDVTNQYKSQMPTRSVMPGAAIDFDGDLIDDLVILDEGNILKIVKSNGKNFGLALIDSIKTTNVREWTLTAGDLNNDGSNEVIVAGEYNFGSIVSVVNNKLIRKTFNSGIYAQGSNTVDINNDGWLDYFVCNDDGPSKIYMNDKSGNLILTNVIDFKINDPTDGSGNYGSEWVDVNGDKLPDLCLSKCRAGVEDPNDQRRINRLYVNQGNGSFEEKGAEFGLNSGRQSWVTAFGDIDNDGDQDAFVVNHYGPHELMENINGTSFQEINVAGTFSSFSFQAIMRDFDNDGWLDILLTGVEGSILMHNNKDKTFTIIRNIIGPAPVRSMVVGDFNDDGFLDIHGHLGEPINDVGLTNDQIWFNRPNGNKFIKFNLVGSSSNISGIGAQLELYGEWGKQVRYVKGGESYGIFNSFQQVFGLGSATMADSLIIYWPSGTIDKYYNITSGNTYLIQEGNCISTHIDLYPDVQILTDTSLVLEALPDFASYIWSNGEVTSQILGSPGTYHVKMTDTKGCVTVSKPIVVLSGCFKEGVKLINISESLKRCEGTELQIFASEAAHYIWHNGSNSAFFTTNQTGWVTLSASDYCGNTVRDSVYVEFVNIDWKAQGDTITKGSVATLTSSHKNTEWYVSPDYINPIFIGDTLKTEPLDVTKIYYAKAIQVVDKNIDFVGENTFPTSNFYGANTTAANMVFSVEKKCILHAVNVNTDTEGIRRILITNAQNEIIFSKDVMLDVGITKVVLDAGLEPGLGYRIRTDENINLTSFGFRSPRLVRTFNNTSYPYTIENTLTILSSSFGAQYFMYFYDWEVHHELQTCESKLVDVVALVEMENSTVEALKKYVTLYPNPVRDVLQISLDEKVTYAAISSLHDPLIINNLIHERNIDVSGWPAGMYVLHFMAEGKLYHIKWVKL